MRREKNPIVVIRSTKKEQEKKKKIEKIGKNKKKNQIKSQPEYSPKRIRGRNSGRPGDDQLRQGTNHRY